MSKLTTPTPLISSQYDKIGTRALGLPAKFVPVKPGYLVVTKRNSVKRPAKVQVGHVVTQQQRYG